jgi:hypothetical protein
VSSVKVQSCAAAAGAQQLQLFSWGQQQQQQQLQKWQHWRARITLLLRSKVVESPVSEHRQQISCTSQVLHVMKA